MPLFQQTKILPFKPRELFNLVWDIEAYPKFLPWCVGARIISEDGSKIIAELVISLKGFSESYRSQVTSEFINEIYSINTIAISGPFKYLESNWQFIPTLTGTELSFSIDFKMKSVILDKLIGTYFTQATEKMIIAFEKRAEERIAKPIIKNN